jgi:hypothetical protein
MSVGTEVRLQIVDLAAVLGDVELQLSAGS